MGKKKGDNPWFDAKQVPLSLCLAFHYLRLGSVKLTQSYTLICDIEKIALLLFLLDCSWMNFLASLISAGFT